VPVALFVGAQARRISNLLSVGSDAAEQAPPMRY
jgi:hypothetical protein